MRLGDRSRRVDSEGARAPKKVLEVKDRHHSKCHNSYFHSFIDDVKMLKDTYHFFSSKHFQSKGRPEWQPVYGKNKLAAPAKGSTNAFKFSDSGHISTYM